MRVRQLQTHLHAQGLVHASPVSNLKGLKIGLDTAFWLRSIQKLKDPLADALGGLPPGIFELLEKELTRFQRMGMTPVFLFEGIMPIVNHSQALHLNTLYTQVSSAWTHMAEGNRTEAQRVFAMSTSRINADVENLVFHHLRARGYECVRAPYFVGAQLAHFAEAGLVQAVMGQPGLLLYGVPKVIIALDFSKQSFDWVELKGVLDRWNLSHDQLVDGCLLAGTEYCLTFPYLHGDDQQQRGEAQQKAPELELALELIQQHPLINWMQVFPSEDIRVEHVYGYCVAKVLLQHTPVLHSKAHAVRPLRDENVPSDLATLIGLKLAPPLYMLLCSGAISRSPPAALCTGKWYEKDPPLVDSQEYRQLVIDLADYRGKALGLLLQWLQPQSIGPVLCRVYWEPLDQGQPQGHEIHPKAQPSVRWVITKDMLAAEKKRQGVDKVGISFCLKWHATIAEEAAKTFGMIQDGSEPRRKEEIEDEECLICMSHFLLLECLELIGNEGDMTVLGDALKDVPEQYAEECLFVLELMKFGVLTEQPFEAVPDRPFPEKLHYPITHETDEQRSIFLLSRVLSLVPMPLAPQMWDAHVDFDLAAFASLVRILKRTLREMTEASLCNLLFQNMAYVEKLSQHLFNPADQMGETSQSMLPTFSIPRTCMGVVWKHILTWDCKNPSNEALREELKKQFPGCIDPCTGLKKALSFWKEVHRCIKAIEEPLELGEFNQYMNNATMLIEQKAAAFGLLDD